jgi:hypothetical protein
MSGSMVPRVLRCDQCGRRYRGRGDWNVTVRAGVIVGALCPRCQTPEENAEAVIHESTLDYGEDGHGRLTGRPKGSA